MDNSYHIFTDATAELTEELVAAYGVSVIAMPVTLAERSFRHYADYRELSSREFYDGLRAGMSAQTTQINIVSYLRAFIPQLKAGRDILYFCLSSGLSGTIQTANMAMDVLREKFPARKLVCMDSLCASAGQSMLCAIAAAKQREGLSFDELLAWAEGARRHICHWFTVEDLHHLHRGGRLSKAAAVAGTMLQIKPVLTMDDEGRLQISEKIRGTARAYEAMVKHLKESAVRPEEQTVFICHGDNFEGVEKLKALVAGLVKEIVVVPVGPVIGAHTGPGMLGMVYWGEKRA